ncbi:MAG: MarR family transcriptional regulator [Steroidobacteraceae bacterium]
MPADSTRSRRKDALRTWLRLLSCESVMEQKLRSLFRDNFTVTLPQFDVLSELDRADHPPTMSELSRELKLSNGNITGVIDRLVRMGLVERSRPDHDRRIQQIVLTSKGTKEFRRMASRHAEWVDKLLAALSQKDLQQLQALLVKVRHSIESNDSRGHAGARN